MAPHPPPPAELVQINRIRKVESFFFFFLRFLDVDHLKVFIEFVTVLLLFFYVLVF